VDPSPGPANPLQRPSVQWSAVAVAIVTLLQALGFVGTPFDIGQQPTQTGTLSTLIPLITGFLGSTGIFGKLGGTLGNLFGAFANKSGPTH
jgi:hypothetical protein